MSNTPTPIYFDDALLSEEDIPILCHDFKIPFNDLTSAVEQIRSKGQPIYSLFQSTVRERIRDFYSHISLNAPESNYSPGEDPMPCLVVDGMQETILATEPSVAALDSPAPVQSAPEPLPEPKKDKPATYESPTITIPENTGPAFTAEELESIEPAPLGETDSVTDNAAVMLMRAMTSGEGHFIITDDGVCTINQDSPPSLVHSYQVVQNVIRLGGLSEKVKDKQSWMLGSITASLEDYHGEAFNISQVCEQTDKAENTIRQAVSVFRKFKDKKYNLSYSHHQEAYHIKVPWETTCLILHKAECYELSAKNVRALGSIVKTMDDNQVVRNIRSNQQAHDLIDAYRQAKIPYLVFTEGTWIRITGVGMDLPMASEEDHFPVVLDLKNWVSYANGERMSDIPKRGFRKD